MGRGNRPFRSRQRGIALVEVALALILVTVLYISFGPLVLKSQSASVAKVVATDHTTFRSSAGAYFQSNRAAFMAAMQDGTGASNLCVVNVATDGSGGTQTVNTTLHRCAIDVSMLKFLGAIPATVSAKNRYGETWVAVFKAVYSNDATPVPTGGVEMYVVSANVSNTAGGVAANPAAFDEAITAAGFAGGQGGVVPDADRSACVASRAKGVYQTCGSGWKANLGDFLDASEVAAFASRLSN